MLDKVAATPALALHAALHTSLNHRPADGFAATFDKVRHRLLDTRPDGGHGVGPAASNMRAQFAAVMPDFRSHAGLDDRFADARPAFLHGTGAGMRERLLRDHRNGKHQ